MSPKLELNGQLRSIARGSLCDVAVEELRNAITVGVLKPGQHLVETQLSEELGISRGPLREALRLLQQEGLVIQDHRGRTYVPLLGHKLISDTFQVRIALEVSAAITISTSADRDARIAPIKERFADLKEAGPDFPSIINADLAFHREICLAAHNDVLLAKWDSISAIIRMSVLHAGEDQARINTSARHHQPLLDVLTSDSITEIWQVMQAHNMESLHSIMVRLPED